MRTLEMYKFSRRSQENLVTCETQIQLLFGRVIRHYDCSVLCGFRNKERQDEAYRGGYSKVKHPDSRHNLFPAPAVDVVPYPVDWQDIARFREFMMFVKGVAAGMGIRIRCGGEFRGGFKDYPHFELV